MPWRCGVQCPFRRRSCPSTAGRRPRPAIRLHAAEHPVEVDGPGRQPAERPAVLLGQERPLDRLIEHIANLDRTSDAVDLAPAAASRDSASAITVEDAVVGLSAASVISLPTPARRRFLASSATMPAW